MKRFIGTLNTIRSIFESSSKVLLAMHLLMTCMAMMLFANTATASTSFQVSLDSPISNVTVYVFSDSGTYLSKNAKTDSNGAVTFDLEDGSYQFRADYQAKQFWSSVVAVPQNTSTNVVLGVQTVAVNLSDSISGVRVYAFTGSGSYLNLYANSDSNGQVSFNLSLGTYTFRADYQTKQFWSSAIDTGTTTMASIDLGIETVTVSLSANVANVRIYAFTGGGTYFNLYANSDSQGQVQFELSAGQYKFRADYQEKQFWSDVVSTPGQLATSIDLGVVDVEVSLSEAISGIGVYAFTGNGVYLNLYETSDSYGKVHFNLSSGDYKFRVDYQSSQYWSDEITTPSDTTANIVLGNSSVHVSLSAAIEGVQMYAFSGSGQYLSLTSLTSASGTAEFDLAAGSYKFRADYLGSQYWSPVISTPGQLETTIDLNMAMVTVSLSSAISNLPINLYDEIGNYLGETVSTDSSGQAQFELSEGTYFFRSDYQMKSYSSSVISTPAETTATINLGIQNVQVGLSSPVEGVDIYVFTGSDEYLNIHGESSATGEVTFELADGSYRFRADYLESSYWSSTITTSVSTNASIDLQLVDVVVSLEDSISGVPIFLYKESGEYLGIQKFSDETGTVVFSLSAGSYKFRGDYQSYQYWSLPIVTPTETSAYVPIDLQSITVQLSLPVTGIPVYLFNGSGDYLSDYDYSDENGRVSFELAGGSFQFRADYLGSQYWSDIINVPGQSDAFVDLGAALVTAKVIDNEGQGLEGIRVHLFTDDGDYLNVYADTDSSGEAEFELSEGPYRFRADYQSKQYWSETFMAAMTTVNIETHQVPVTVTLIPSLEGIPVYVFDDEGTTYLDMNGSTNADGQVVFHLAQGNVRFRADYLTRQLWSTVLSPPAEQAVSLDLQLETTTACVKKQNEDPMTGVTVYLFTSTGTYLNRYGSVNSSGCWSVDIPPGNYKFRADRFGYQYWSDEFSAPTSGEIEIQTGVHSVEAQVVPPFSNATVYLFRPPSTYLSVNANTDQDGKATFELPIGSFQFRADYNGGQYWSDVFEALGAIYVEIDTGLGECSEDADCEAGEVCQLGSCVLVAVCSEDVECDDENPCTSDSCISGQCEHANLSDGVSCVADAFSCTINETCQSGVCVVGVLDHAQCDDTNPCTQDICNPDTGCTYSNVSDGMVCAAENDCREESICQSGSCIGTNKTDGTSCSDAFDCTSGETCQSGVCVAGNLNDLACDDGNACTDDLCLADTGCSNTPSTNGTICDDGNICTQNDSCFGGSCSGGTPVADGSPCPDSNECTSSEQCWSGVCTIGILDHDSCNDSNPCTEDVCDASLGCTNANKADGIVCSDGNQCTENSSCQSGQCIGANKPDGTSCTFDAIDCTINETCQGGVCTIGEFDHSACSDAFADDCLIPQCVQEQGCLSDAANAPDGTPCEDNDPCTVYTACQAGNCVGTQICGDEDAEEDVDVPNENLALSIDTPLANAFLDSPDDVVVSGTFSASSGYESLLVNGTAATITAGTYFCEIDLTEGQNTIQAVLTGSVGTTLSREVVVTIDSQVPQIMLSSPSMALLPATVWENPYPLQGTVVEDNLASLKLTTAEGIRYLSPIAGSFSSLLNLELGANEFSITAVDRAGNSFSLTPGDGFILTLEQQAPSVSISAPESGYESSTATVDVVVSAQTASGHTMDQVSITRTNGGNQSVWTHASDGEWTQAVTLLNGTNTIVARIQDTYLGQTYTSEASVVVQYLLETETDLDVLSVSPEANGTEIAVDEVFSLQFNKICDRASLDEKLRMETADGKTIPLRVHVPEDSTLVGIAPTNPLPYKSTVYLIVQDGLLAASGPGLTNSKQYQYVTEPPPTYIVGNVHDALMLPHAGVPLEVKGTSCTGTVGNTGSFRIRCEEEGVFDFHIKADKVNPPGHRIVKKIHLVKEQENDIGLTIIAPQFLDNLRSYDGNSDERQHLDFGSGIPGVFLDFPAKTLVFDEPGADTLCLSPIVQSMCPYAIEGLEELSIDQMYQVAPAPRLAAAGTPAVFQFPNAYELSPGDPVLLIAGNRGTKKLAIISIGQVKDSGSEILFLVGTEALGRLEFLGVVPVTDEDGKANLNQIISDSFEDESIVDAAERILGSANDTADGDEDSTETAVLFRQLRNWVTENVWQKQVVNLFISPAWAQVSADPAMAGYQSMLGTLGGASFSNKTFYSHYAIYVHGYVHTGAQYFGAYSGNNLEESLADSVPSAWLVGDADVMDARGSNGGCAAYLEYLRFGDTSTDNSRHVDKLWKGKTYKDIINQSQDWCRDDDGLWMGPLPLPDIPLYMLWGNSGAISTMDEEVTEDNGSGFFRGSYGKGFFGSYDELMNEISSNYNSHIVASYSVPVGGATMRNFYSVTANTHLIYGTSIVSGDNLTNVPLNARFVTGNIGFFPRPGTPYKYLSPTNGAADPVGSYYTTKFSTRKGILWGVQGEGVCNCPVLGGSPADCAAGYTYDIDETYKCERRNATDADCDPFRTTYNATSQQLIHLGRSDAFTEASFDHSSRDDINQTEVYLFRYKELDNQENSESVNALVASVPAIDLSISGDVYSALKSEKESQNGTDNYYLSYPNSVCAFSGGGLKHEGTLMWAAPFSIKLFQNVTCIDRMGECGYNDETCIKSEGNGTCYFRSAYDNSFFSNLLENLNVDGDDEFRNRYIYNEYLKERIKNDNAVTRSMSISNSETILALAINRSTGYVGARLWDPERDYKDDPTSFQDHASNPHNQVYIGPINIPLFPPEIHLLVKRKPKSIPGGGDRQYLVASQGVGNTKDRTVGIELNWRIPVIKSFNCKTDDSECRLSKTEQETISEKLALYFKKPKDDGKNELRINPYRVSFHHRRELTAAVDVNGNVQHAEGTFSSGEIRPGWQTVGLNIPVDDESDFPVSTLSIRVNPWTMDATSDSDTKGFLAQYHQVADGVAETDGDADVDAEADTDSQPWEKRLEGWYKDNDPTWTSFGQATCLTQREYDEYKRRFTEDLGTTDADGYAMRWVETFESKKSLPNDGLIDMPIVIEERGHLCWVKPCVDLLRVEKEEDIKSTCFGEEAAKESLSMYTDIESTSTVPTVSVKKRSMCKVCYTRESTLDIVSVEASSDPDGDEDDNVGIWAKEDGDTDADPERGPNMLTAGQSEGFLGGDPQSLEIGLGAFIESHFATDDITSPESGVHLYALQIYMPQSNADAQSVYRLCTAVGDGTERLDCGISCSAVPESDRELIGGYCMDPGDWSVVPETFDFDLSTTTGWDWSKVEDYVDVRLFEVGFWFSPLWEYRLYNPVNVKGYNLVASAGGSKEFKEIESGDESEDGAWLEVNVPANTWENISRTDGIPVVMEFRNFDPGENPEITQYKLMARTVNHGNGGRFNAYQSKDYDSCLQALDANQSGGGELCKGDREGESIKMTRFDGSYARVYSMTTVTDGDDRYLKVTDADTWKCTAENGCEDGLQEGAKQTMVILLDGLNAATIPYGADIEIVLGYDDGVSAGPACDNENKISYWDDPENPGTGTEHTFCKVSSDRLAVTPWAKNVDLGHCDVPYQCYMGLNLTRRNAIVGPFTDFTFDGPLPFAVTRTYNSRDFSVGSLGDRWTYNVSRQLILAEYGVYVEDNPLTTEEDDEVRTETRLVWIRPDGKRVRFTLHPYLEGASGNLSPDENGDVPWLGRRYYAAPASGLQLMTAENVSGVSGGKAWIVYDPVSGYAEVYEADAPPYRLRKVVNPFADSGTYQAITFTYKMESPKPSADNNYAAWLNGEYDHRLDLVNTITIPGLGGTLNFTYTQLDCADGGDDCRVNTLSLGSDLLVTYNHNSPSDFEGVHNLETVNYGGTSQDYEYTSAVNPGDLTRVAYKIGSNTSSDEVFEYHDPDGEAIMGGVGQVYKYQAPGWEIEFTSLNFVGGEAADAEKADAERNYLAQRIAEGNAPGGIFDAASSESKYTRTISLVSGGVTMDYLFTFHPPTHLPLLDHGDSIDAILPIVGPDRSFVPTLPYVISGNTIAGEGDCPSNPQTDEDFKKWSICTGVYNSGKTGNRMGEIHQAIYAPSGTTRADYMTPTSATISGGTMDYPYEPAMIGVDPSGPLGTFKGGPNSDQDNQLHRILPFSPGSTGTAGVNRGGYSESYFLEAASTTVQKGTVPTISTVAYDDGLTVSGGRPESGTTYYGNRSVGTIQRPGPDIVESAEDGVTWLADKSCMESTHCVDGSLANSSIEAALKRFGGVTVSGGWSENVTAFHPQGGVPSEVVSTWLGNSIATATYDALGRPTAITDSAMSDSLTFTYTDATVDSPTAISGMASANYPWLGGETTVNPLEHKITSAPNDGASGILFTWESHSMPQTGLTHKILRDDEVVYTACYTKSLGDEPCTPSPSDAYGDGTILGAESSLGVTAFYTYVNQPDLAYNGQVASVTTGNAASCSDGCEIVDFAYDTAGRLNAVTSAEHEVAYTYDSLGRVTSMMPTGLNESTWQYGNDDTVHQLLESSDGAVTGNYTYGGPLEKLNYIVWECPSCESGAASMGITYSPSESIDYLKPTAVSYASEFGDDTLIVDTAITRNTPAGSPIVVGGTSTDTIGLTVGGNDPPVSTFLTADVTRGGTSFIEGRALSAITAGFGGGYTGDEFTFTGDTHGRITTSMTAATFPMPSVMTGDAWTGSGPDGSLLHPAYGGIQDYTSPASTGFTYDRDAKHNRITGISAGSFSLSASYNASVGEYVDSESLTYPDGSIAWTYTYDAAGRLSAASSSDHSITYVYDTDGALASVTGGPAGDAFTRSGYLTASSTKGVLSSDYDASGRLKHWQGKRLAYDPRGRLAKVCEDADKNEACDENGAVTTYLYDAGGMRLFKRHIDPNDPANVMDDTASMTRYVYNGANLAAERTVEYHKPDGYLWNAEDMKERRYVWLGLRPVAMVESECTNLTFMGGTDWSCSAWSEPVYYDIVTDRIGRPVMVLDASGSTVWKAKYSPYGITYDLANDPDDDGETLTFNLRQPGQYFDSETGFYYNGQRYYIPEMRRYNRPEPIGQAGSLDLYMYAGGNPVNRIDPTGLAPQDALMDWAASDPEGFRKTMSEAAPKVLTAAAVTTTVVGVGVACTAGAPACAAAVGVATVEEGTGIPISLAGALRHPLRTAKNIWKGLGRLFRKEADEAASVVMRHGDMPSPRPEGMQSHHGVNSVYMEANYPNYSMNDAPAILMKNMPDHNATRAVFNKVRKQLADRQGVGIRDINWKRVSPGEAWWLAEEQFRKTNVPQQHIEEYFRQFNKYLEEIK